ncbi:MAG: efflux RND transporter periplasmic adaptor subunit [Armatimonadota bacterium]|nr:efflux RND transporter periplasmic adaptor subunit [Armatimonadota bacterium]
MQSSPIFPMKSLAGFTAQRNCLKSLRQPVRSISLAKSSLAVSSVLCLLLVGCGHGDNAAKGDAAAPAADAAPAGDVAVSMITVAPATVNASLAVTGTLAPLPGAEAKVAPAVPGRVSGVLVRNGQLVTRGQLIATMDPGPLLGQARQAEATLLASQVALEKLLAGSRPEEIARSQSDVAGAQATLTNAIQNLQRQRVLFAEGLVAKKDVQAADLIVATSAAAVRSASQDLSLKRAPNRPQDITAAQAAVAQSQGSLQAARAQLAAQSIRSPVTGTVVQRTANPGEYVDTTGSIATIVDLSRVQLILQVPASQVGAIHAGETVQFTPETQPGHEYTARVTTVSGAVTSGSDTVAVEAVASNSGNRLRDDGFVQARIVTAVHPGALVVPVAAVVSPDGKPSVFVVDSKNIAHAKEVSEGVREGDRVQILTGLKDGDRVVTTGAYELSDGTHVKGSSND